MGFRVNDLNDCGRSFSSVCLTVARAGEGGGSPAAVKDPGVEGTACISLLWHHRVGSTGSPSVSPESRKGMIC